MPHAFLYQERTWLSITQYLFDDQAELNYYSSLLDTICPPWLTLPATTNPSQECTMKQTREVLEQVEGTGARSLQRYIMKRSEDDRGAIH
jgi:hypothetical protein